jgi:hypothetical protein
MKLSHVTIGILLLNASSANAQSNPSLKSDTSRVKLSSDPKINLASKDTVILIPPKKNVDEKYCCNKCGLG